MRRAWTGVAACAALLGGVSPAPARTWRVDPAGPGDAVTIGAALAVAAAGDTVLVACGIYAEHDLVLGAGVTLRGETGDPRCVTVDAAGGGRVLDCEAADPPATVAGLTLRGGRATSGGFPASLGGGLRCQGGTLAVRNCVITDCEAQYGGGIGVHGAVLALADCVLEGNAAAQTGWAAGGALYVRDVAGEVARCVWRTNTAFAVDTPGDGGAVFCDGSGLAFTDCVFLANAAGAGAGAFYSYRDDASVLLRCHFEGNTAGGGGAVYLEQSRARLQECGFRANSATIGGALFIARLSTTEIHDSLFEDNGADPYAGGAVDCWRSDALFRGCLFRGNQAGAHGGALACGDHARPVLEDCLLTGNAAANRGGAVSCRSTASLSMEGCTLHANGAPRGGGVSCDAGGDAEIARTIVSASPDGEAARGVDAGALVLSCSDLYGNAGGDWVGDLAGQLGTAGNLSAPPLHCDPDGDDFTLDAASPCLPAGNDCAVLIGARGEGCARVPVLDAPPPAAGLLRSIHPNPFNPRAIIVCELPRARSCRLTIHDPAGRLVRVLIGGRTLPAGRHDVAWDGRDDAGRAVAAGVYICRLEAGGAGEARRLVLVR